MDWILVLDVKYERKCLVSSTKTSLTTKTEKFNLNVQNTIAKMAALFNLKIKEARGDDKDNLFLECSAAHHREVFALLILTNKLTESLKR